MKNQKLHAWQQQFFNVKALGYVPALIKKSSELITFLRLMDKLPLQTFVQVNPKLTNKNKILFNSVPTSKHALKKLFTLYGYANYSHPKLRLLNVIVQANCKTLVGDNYPTLGSHRFLFQLKVDYSLERLYLAVYDYSLNLLEQELYWSFSSLATKLKRRTNLIVVKAWSKEEKNTTYYKYYDLTTYILKPFCDILKLIEEGSITVSLNIYEEKKGQVHYSSPSFMVQEINLFKLYTKVNQNEEEN